MAAAEYRELRPNELPEAVALWTEVFSVEARFFTSLLESSDGVSVAALVDGRIVSSVHVFMRSIRDREGRPLKVGGIGSVSTHPGHRKQGHSGRLLEIAIFAMEREGCVWSLLGTGVNDHYARYGWRTVSTPYRSGRLKTGIRGEATFLETDDATLAAMASLHTETTAARPMATVRSESAWRTAVRYRLRPEQAISVGTFDGDRLSAYVVARKGWSDWTISDAAGDESRYPELFAAVAGSLVDKGAERVTSLLPDHPAYNAGLAGIVEKVEIGEARGEMLRPIADRISWPDLFALYGDPRGRPSDLDAF